MQTTRVTLATGLTYNVLQWGPAQASRTVVLLHGFLDLAWSWVDVAPRLAAPSAAHPGGTHVIAPDLRGHGDSDRIGAGGYYHFLDYIADVDSLIAQLAPGPVVVVGHSMGGSIASYWVGTRPERVTHLALLEGLGPPEAAIPLPQRMAKWIDAWKKIRATDESAVGTLASIEDAAARLRRHDALLSVEKSLELAEHGSLELVGGSRRWKHDPLHMTQGPYPYQRALAAQFWRAIACPVLLVDGAESTFRLPPAETAERTACIANATTSTLPSAGHMMMRHQPAALAEMIRGFIA